MDYCRLCSTFILDKDLINGINCVKCEDKMNENLKPQIKKFKEDFEIVNGVIKYKKNKN